MLLVLFYPMRLMLVSVSSAGLIVAEWLLANREVKMMPGDFGAGSNKQEVTVSSGPVELPGILTIPDNPLGIVVFAHGSGSGRFSPRNNYVAGVLQAGQIATLLTDLLTEPEAEDVRYVFDISLLADRLIGITTWLKKQAQPKALSIGLFGASTGAGAALEAAARDAESIDAVVSRGGRPDLAAPYLSQVRAPTLLIVGGNDQPVIEMNRSAYALMSVEKSLVIVPGATHLFEEAGTLERVAELARDWFKRYLKNVPRG
jgi:putative phosphoribosyl transferase